MKKKNRPILINLAIAFGYIVGNIEALDNKKKTILISLVIALTIFIAAWTTGMWKNIFNYIEYILFDKLYSLFSIKWFAAITIGIILIYSFIDFILDIIVPDRKINRLKEEAISGSENAAIILSKINIKNKNYTYAYYWALLAEILNSNKVLKIKRKIEKQISPLQKQIAQSDFIETFKEIYPDKIMAFKEYIENSKVQDSSKEYQNYKIPTSIYILNILSWIMGAVMHAYTIYLIYIAKGLTAALITFFLPVFSQIYWVYYKWQTSGNILNDYSLIICAYIIILLIFFIFKIGIIHISRKTIIK